MSDVITRTNDVQIAIILMSLQYKKMSLVRISLIPNIVSTHGPGQQWILQSIELSSPRAASKLVLPPFSNIEPLGIYVVVDNSPCKYILKKSLHTMIELPRLPLISLDTAEETNTHEIARGHHTVIGEQSSKTLSSFFACKMPFSPEHTYNYVILLLR
jgi:hypothetical protein